MKKKEIVLWLTDPHLDKDNGALVKDIFRQAIKICKDRRIWNMVCGGDVFTNRSGQPLETLTDFIEITEMIKEAGLVLDVIPGNHDKTDANSNKSYLDLYNDGDQIRVHQELASQMIEGVWFHFIPYFKDDRWLSEYSDFNKEVLKTDYVNILVTHTGFEGVKNNDGSEVESEIKPSMFKDFDLVLVGHYHNSSMLAKNILYTGSAYQNNFGETITNKGFCIINNDATLRFIPSKFPRYIREDVDVNDTETIRNLVEKYDGNKSDHIRFVFHGKDADRHKVNIGELSKLGFDAKYESTEQTEAIEVSESESVLTFDKKTMLRDFLKFAAENEIKGKQLVYGMNLIKTI